MLNLTKGKIMNIIRQGDVYLALVTDDIEVKETMNHVVLAEGEVTGHSHRVENPDIANLFVGKDGRTYLRVVAKTSLVHEEHGTLMLDPGLYRYWIQVEYTPQGLRQVMD
jgi:hypothetical protein